MKYLLVLAILMILGWSTCDCKTSTSVKRHQRRCRPENHRYYDEERNRCKRCPKCAVGRGLLHHYQDIKKQPWTNLPLTCYKCLPCTDGYYSEHRDYASCRPCYNCTMLGRLDFSVCDTSQNTKCGACQPGFHDIYKKMTEVEDITRPCQKCEYAEDDVSDCLTYVHSVPAKRLTSTVKPVEALQSYTTPIHATKNHFSSNESQKGQREINSEKGVKLILLEKLTTVYINPDHLGPDKEEQTRNDERLNLLAWGGGFVVAFVTLVIPVTFWFVVRRITQTLNHIPSTTDAQGSTSSTNPNADPQRELFASSLETDVEPDSSSLGRTMPLLNRRQQGVPSVHGKKKKSSCSHKSATGQTYIRFPDKQLSLDQKYLLRRMGVNWADLGRAMGLTDASIDCLRDDYRGNLNEQIYQMIISLERSNPERATVGNVYSVLLALHQDTLSHAFLETIRMSESHLPTTPPIQYSQFNAIPTQ